MIVWSGWGILALLIAAAGGAGGTGIGVALGGATDRANPGTAVGLALAAIAIWLVGQRLNRPTRAFHPQTGQAETNANRHRFFFVPMQYWGPLLGLAAVAVGIQAFTG